MKNYRRALRRHKKHVKFIKRAKKWFANNSWGDYNLQSAIEGKCSTWLRTTGRPCNCYMCTYEKYTRDHKSKRIPKDN